MPRSLFSLLFLLVPWISYSQNDSLTANSLRQPVHFLLVSYGTITTDYVLDGYKPGRPTTRDYTNQAPSAALCLAYKFRCTDEGLYVGITAGIEQEHGDWLDNEIYDGNVFDLQTTVKGSYVRTNFTFGADFTQDYLVAGILRMYATGGLGVTYEFETDQYNTAFYDQGYWHGVNNYGPIRKDRNIAHINGFFSPLGISVGKGIRYFLEVGFGYKGMMNTGIACGFHHKTYGK